MLAVPSQILRAGCIGAFLSGALTGTLLGQEKVTYQDHVVPVFRNNCFKCHSQDTAKGDLDLSTFGAALRGGSSGPGLVSGDADGSKLFKVVAHVEEPKMPPNSKISDKELEILRKWIAGGLLENSGSKAIASNAPKVDLAVGAGSLGKPDGPPPMPLDWLLEPVVRTERTTAVIGLAASPWAPLVALTGQRQVLLYNTDSLELAGVVKFPNGHPTTLRFSRNGKLLLAAGGEGAKLGLVSVWDIVSGERVITVGEEFDTVLAADISADQKWIAMGGPSKLVKLYSTQDGRLRHSIKKHTDWVTAAEFSPNGKYLATGDRVGGILVWEAASGQELYSLRSHRGAITGLSWRGDSALLCSASEDGTAKTWKVEEEAVVRSWTAHNGGAVSGAYTHNGQVVTAGRDNQITVWEANGNRKRSFASTNDIPVRAVFSHDGKRVVASDWKGNVFVWDSEDGKLAGQLSANPPTLATRLEEAGQQLAELNAKSEKLAAELTVARTEFSALETQQSDKNAIDAARKKSADLEAGLQSINSQKELIKTRMTVIQTALFNVQVHAAKDSLEQKELEHAKLLASIEEAKATAGGSTEEIARSRRRLDHLNDRLEGLKNVARFDRKYADEAASILKLSQKPLIKLKERIVKAEAAQEKASVDQRDRHEKDLAKFRVEADLLEKEVARNEAQVAAAQKDMEQTRSQAAALEKELSEEEKKIRNLLAQQRKAQMEVASAEARTEKSAKALALEKAMVENLSATYQKMKTAPPTVQASLP